MALFPAQYARLIHLLVAVSLLVSYYLQSQLSLFSALLPFAPASALVALDDIRRANVRQSSSQQVAGHSSWSALLFTY